MNKTQDLHYQTISRIAQVTGQLIWLGNKRFAQQLATYGLTPPQYFTLVSLFFQERPRSMHILAEITHQDAATVTGIVDRLIKLGYVSRQRGEDDRRKVYVTLEEAGREVVEAIRQINHENWQRAFSALSQDELEEMLRMLSTVLEVWRSISQPTTQKRTKQATSQTTNQFLEEL
jgi:DNA-binding MarR family transcriptional regulator